MIIVKLSGGLGNQLFQYVLARYLSIKNKCQFKLDITGFETYKLHNYTLSNFNIVENIANRLEILWLKNPIRAQIDHHLTISNQSHVRDRGFTFDPFVFNVGKSVYLDGYWQSEKYFKDVEQIIGQDLTLRNPLGEGAENIATQIVGQESVSLHIRRGDYANRERTKKVHGLCSLDYYYKSIDLILNKVSTPIFFIFSDDIKWARENLDMRDLPVVFVSDGNNKIKNFEELHLMSLCRHNIIANSSFSWWGAWLNRNANKIVITPKQWFADESKNTKDLIPDSWISL